MTMGIVEYLKWRYGTMRIVQFYREEIGNQNGNKLSAIMEWSNHALEVDHDYIQWMFPSNEKSMLNRLAPVLTREEAHMFQSDPELRAKLLKSFERFLSFLDLKLEEGPKVVQIDQPSPWWLNGFNHTMLRITRILKCLRLCGLQEYALAFYTFLGGHKNAVSANTWSYWKSAAIEPLWETSQP